MDTKDSNGNILSDGETVQITKDLKVKGSNTALKRSNLIKNIRLTAGQSQVEYGAGKSSFVLRTEFLKKA